MKEKMKLVLAMVAVATSATLPAARVDTRDTAGFYIATGVEMIGSADGSTVTEWDTTLEPDGWATLAHDGGSLRITRPAVENGGVDVLVLNASASVVGGRMSTNEVWDDERVVVVRDDIVVPLGLTLTLGAGCIVKFTEGARIIVEDGGTVVANGAYLAAFDDDSVGGDTDMNGRRDGGLGTSRPTNWWLDVAALAALSTVRFVDGSTNLPTRTYTAGVALGALPELVRADAMFRGWWTSPDGEGAVATQEDVVENGETVLYAHWIPYELSIEPSSVDVGCLATNDTFTVTANSEWEVSCDVDWVTVRRVGDNAPYQVAYAVSENANAEARVATIRVTMRRVGDNVPCQNGANQGGAPVMQCDFTLAQAGMAQLAAPTITPADGTTFVGASRRVSISGAESGAEIRYTLDGSEPTATSKLYTKSFNVFDTTVVKAKAFKSGNRPSETVSARIVRLRTLAEALDVPLWTVTTGGDAIWTVAEIEGRNGGSCARSGGIGDDQTSTLTTSVDGAGTLTFWWRADCEDDPDYDNWDFLMFKVDGAEIARIDGDSGWCQVTVKIKSEGVHTLMWTYTKDYMDDDMTGIEDCGWVDQVVWTPLVGENEVPVAWLEGLGLVSAGMSAADAANADPDGDGLTTAQEYVAGTDPNDSDSKFTASIEMVDDQPVVTYTPDLLDERQYKTFGKKDLGNLDEPWVEVKDGEEGNYNFFKVTVELP